MSHCSDKPIPTFSEYVSPQHTNTEAFHYAKVSVSKSRRYDKNNWIVISWTVTPCLLTVANVSEERITAVYFCPEDGCGKFIRNVGNHLQDYTASQRMSWSSG